MRLLKLAAILLSALIGVVFAALNTAVVTIDLYFTQFSIPLGVLVLATVLLGAIVGSTAVVFGSLLPQRRRMRRLERALADAGKRADAA